jgi:hypothetical protein
MPQEYTGLGISLMYPDTWRIEEDPSDTEGISVESPGGAFMSIHCYPGINPDEAIENARQVMLTEYEEVETETFTRTITDRLYEVVSQRFVYLDFIIVSQILSFTHAGNTYLVQIQGEDREVDQLQPVFDAMLASVFQRTSVS